MQVAPRVGEHRPLSQRSLHNAPIFRLLLKVAVNGTHQCDFLNFCGPFGAQLNSILKEQQHMVGVYTVGGRSRLCLQSRQ